MLCFIPSFLDGFHGQIAGFVGSGKMEVQVTDVTGNSTLHLKEGDMKLSVLDNPRQVAEVKMKEKREFKDHGNREKKSK